jgi:hypothetical protein
VDYIKKLNNLKIKIKKRTDVIPYNSNWDNTVLNTKLKKRLKIHENDPEPPKVKLDKDRYISDFLNERFLLLFKFV